MITPTSLLSRSKSSATTCVGVPAIAILVLPLFALVLWLRTHEWFVPASRSPSSPTASESPVPGSSPPEGRRVTGFRVASAAVVVVGLFWFFERVADAARAVG